MLAGEMVLFLEEERPRKLQPHPCQLRPVDQDVPQGGDGAVQQHLPLGLVFSCFRRADCRHAGEEQDIDPIGMVRVQGPQDLERSLEPPGRDERPRVLHRRVGGEMGVCDGSTRNAEEDREEQRAQQ